MSLPQPLSSTTKRAQIGHLASQLTLLSQRSEELERLMVTTAEQASYIKLLGGYHASWFMATARILTPKTGVEEN